jgi:hypothetical protein
MKLQFFGFKKYEKTMREQRIRNLQLISDLSDSQFKLPVFKKNEIPEKFGVFYSSKDDKDQFTVCHTTNEYKKMVEWEIYNLVKVVDLDTFEIVINQQKVFSKK